MREGSYAPVTPAPASSTDGHAARSPSPAPATQPPPVGNGGHGAWDGPPAAVDRRAVASPTAERDRSFGNELVSDKSLDEVILEYLSDDSEADES